MKCLMIIMAMISATTTGSDANVHTHKRLVDAIHMVETSGRVGPILGDGGAALGPLQIHRACWIDANIGGTYAECSGLAYSKRVFAAYLARYCTSRRLGRPVTDEDRARCWNGGPNAHKATGRKKKNLDRYWNKVRKELTR